MKLLFTILCFSFIFSCGSSKSVSNETNIVTETVTSTTPPDPQGGEFIPPKEDDSKVEMPEVTVTESNNSVEETTESVNTVNENEVKETINTIALEAFDHNSFNNLLKKHVTKEGNVDYKGFKNDSKSLRHYISLLGLNMPSNDWSKDDNLAYWINAYNAMTIDLIIRNYPIKSIKDIDKPWDQRLWKLGSKWYNLDEIEHQIIRKMGEPRIHFALVCAAKSCPKLYNRAFTASNLEEALTQLTKTFLKDPTKNSISSNSMKLSKIFKWFAKDFKQNGTLIDFLNQYTDTTISNNAKKSFKDYNWDLNE